MNTFAKRFSWFLAGLMIFATVTAAFALTVTYKPYGVPDSRREEYEDKISEIRGRRALMETMDETAHPEAHVANKTHDFGMVDPHETMSHTFQVINKGDDPLALEMLETSCKCTVGSLNDGVLEPGESTDVTLTWNTGYKAEEYTQTATLKTNDPLQKTLVLTVKGEVRAKFIAPKKVAFNKSDPGSRATSSFVLYSQLWDDFIVKDVRCDRDDFDWLAEPIENSDLALADKYPSSAWRLNLFTRVENYDEYQGKMTLVVAAEEDGEIVEQEIEFSGKVRSPINFLRSRYPQGRGIGYWCGQQRQRP